MAILLTAPPTNISNMPSNPPAFWEKISWNISEHSVENLLKGIIVASGNDACVALAEGIAGSEEEFAVMMTSKAKEIGIQKALYSITTSPINSLTPKRELSWFIYPITRALIENNMLEGDFCMVN